MIWTVFPVELQTFTDLVDYIPKPDAQMQNCSLIWNKIRIEDNSRSCAGQFDTPFSLATILYVTIYSNIK